MNKPISQEELMEALEFLKNLRLGLVTYEHECEKPDHFDCFLQEGIIKRLGVTTEKYYQLDLLKFYSSILTPIMEFVDGRISLVRAVTGIFAIIKLQATIKKNNDGK